MSRRCIEITFAPTVFSGLPFANTESANFRKMAAGILATRFVPETANTRGSDKTREKDVIEIETVFPFVETVVLEIIVRF